MLRIMGLILFFSGYVSAQPVPKEFMLTPEKCVAAKTENGEIQKIEMDKFEKNFFTTCKIVGEELLCKTNKDEEKFKLVLADGDTLVAKNLGVSESSYLYANPLKNTYSISSMSMGKGSTGSLSCIGKFNAK